eukprot:CFRG3432T1
MIVNTDHITESILRGLDTEISVQASCDISKNRKRIVPNSVSNRVYSKEIRTFMVGKQSSSDTHTTRKNVTVKESCMFTDETRTHSPQSYATTKPSRRFNSDITVKRTPSRLSSTKTKEIESQRKNLSQIGVHYAEIAPMRRSKSTSYEYTRKDKWHIQPTSKGNITDDERNGIPKSIELCNIENDEEWVETQKKAFKRWINEHLRYNHQTIGDDELLEDALADGVRLPRLVEELKGGKKLFSVVNKTKRTCKFHVIVVLSAVLDHLCNTEKLRLVNISSEDIYAKSTKLSLGLVWSLIRHFHIEVNLDSTRDSDGLGKKKRSHKDKLLGNLNTIFIQRGFDRISNFKSDFSNANRFYCLVQHLRALCDVVETSPKKEKTDMDRFMSLTQIEQFTTVFEVAQQEFQIPQLLDMEDIISGKFGESVVMTYLCYYLKVEKNLLKGKRSCNNKTLTVEITNEDSVRPKMKENMEEQASKTSVDVNKFQISSECIRVIDSSVNSADAWTMIESGEFSLAREESNLKLTTDVNGTKEREIRSSTGNTDSRATDEYVAEKAMAMRLCTKEVTQAHMRVNKEWESQLPLEITNVETTVFVEKKAVNPGTEEIGIKQLRQIYSVDVPSLKDDTEQVTIVRETIAKIEDIGAFRFEEGVKQLRHMDKAKELLYIQNAEEIRSKNAEVLALLNKDSQHFADTSGSRICHRHLTKTSSADKECGYLR